MEIHRLRLHCDPPIVTNLLVIIGFFVHLNCDCVPVTILVLSSHIKIVFVGYLILRKDRHIPYPYHTCSVWASVMCLLTIVPSLIGDSHAARKIRPNMRKSPFNMCFIFFPFCFSDVLTCYSLIGFLEFHTAIHVQQYMGYFFYSEVFGPEMTP